MKKRRSVSNMIKTVHIYIYVNSNRAGKKARSEATKIVGHRRMEWELMSMSVHGKELTVMEIV